MIKLKTILSEVEDSAMEAKISAAMKQAFTDLGSEFKTHEDKIKQDVTQSKAGELDEAIGIVAVISLILTLPTLIKTIATAISVIVKLFDKLAGNAVRGKDDQLKIVQTLLSVSDKWFDQYIKGFMWILKVSGVYKKANITDEAGQKKLAEFLYYAIIAGCATHIGIEAASSIKQAGSEVLSKGLANIEWTELVNVKKVIDAGGDAKRFVALILK